MRRYYNYCTSEHEFECDCFNFEHSYIPHYKMLCVQQGYFSFSFNSKKIYFDCFSLEFCVNTHTTYTHIPKCKHPSEQITDEPEPTNAHVCSSQYE